MVNGTRVVALVRDLMFAARIRSVAEGAVVVQRASGLAEAVGSGTRLVLVDLEAPGALEALSEVGERARGARVVAFGPHVAEEKLAAARAAGADTVLTRGRFVRELGELVAGAGG